MWMCNLLVILFKFATGEIHNRLILTVVSFISTAPLSLLSHQHFMRCFEHLCLLIKPRHRVIKRVM